MNSEHINGLDGNTWFLHEPTQLGLAPALILTPLLRGFHEYPQSDAPVKLLSL